MVNKNLNILSQRKINKVENMIKNNRWNDILDQGRQKKIKIPNNYNNKHNNINQFQNHYNQYNNNKFNYN